MRRLAGALDFAPTLPAPTVSWAWSGGVTPSSAVVTARATDVDALTLRLGTTPGSWQRIVAGVEGADSVFRFELLELEPDTAYEYSFAGASLPPGAFRTFPLEGSEHSFELALASCAGHSGGEYRFGDVSDSPAFDRIVDRAPLLFLHQGDRGYPDISSNSPALFRANYNANMAMARQLAMHLAMPVAYHWDDHDFGPNDSHAGSASKPAAQQVYREHVPHWALHDAGGIWQTFVIGRVRVIMLDPRSFRSQDGATDNSSKSMIGTTQKAWLATTLAAAAEPLIVLDVSSPWHGSGGSSWGAFSTERSELIALFDALGVTSRLLIVGADYHYTAADDGTNSPGGIPSVVAAPLDAGYTVADVTFSEGIHRVRKQQYCTLDVDDNSSTIDVNVQGWAVNEGTETELFAMPLSFAA